MNRKIFIIWGFFVALLSSVSVFAAQIDSTNPYKLISGMADATFSNLKANQKKYQADPNLLKNVAKEDILPHINVRYAALKLLGPYAKKATKAERDEFTKAFEDYLITSYAQVLIQYTDQKIEVEKEKPVDAKRSIVSIRVVMIDGSRPPINLDFKLRKNKSTGEWQGYDVQVEGVSMLDTKSSEWQKDLRTKGVSYVAKELEKLADAPIVKKS